MMVTATEVKGQDGKGTGEYAMDTPDSNTILYIDQVAAENNSISFKVYPEALKNSIIMIYGVMPDGSKSLKAAIIEAKYILGDVNGDGEIGTKDLTRLARFLVDSTVEINSDAADVNSDLSIGTKDLTRLARFLVGGPALG